LFLGGGSLLGRRRAARVCRLDSNKHGTPIGEWLLSAAARLGKRRIAT
jgi:hypothetical protein